MKPDLISRSSLKEAIAEYHQKQKERLHSSLWRSVGIDNIYDLIDNAPAVALPIMPDDKYDEVLIAHERIAYERGVADGYAEAIEEDKWIPVSERLPEQANQSYLVTVDYGNDFICACQRFFFNPEIGWNDDCVVAWRPLPEPYKKGGKA